MIEASLRGRIALISGGSRGIGRAIARRFAAAGARVSIGYRSNRPAAEDTLRELHALGADAIATEGDVSTEAGCAALYAATVNGLGNVDILVNNAGSHENNVFMLLDDGSFERLHAVHVMSVVRMTRLVANGMLARRWGRIINISSVAATRPTVGQTNYAAAKAAVEALTRCLAIEFHKRGVTVNCISAGLIDTDMAKDSDSAYVLAHQLVKRLGKADELAAWFLMLASTQGDYVSGQVLDIDGGFMMI
ncbi:MAG: 3-oxoacyl-(acyl-carrier-protein) reductase [Myxococcales bacterium]|nr:3-oxoacyl-(acyl-carrier-protein) reductase [Myxococcales bacterium]